VWADPATHRVLQQCFGYAFREPIPEEKLFRPNLSARMIEDDFEIAGRKWMPIPLMHGTASILGFRVGNLAYCTDVSHIPEESYPLLENLDVLVLDALQYRRHHTHFSLDQAVDAALRIGARQTWFTHIAHALDHEDTNRGLPAGIRLAWDGLRVPN
jgi:phosphoribosyl 1,2-cyclic phosphate phosphodiesterase